MFIQTLDITIITGKQLIDLKSMNKSEPAGFKNTTQQIPWANLNV